MPANSSSFRFEATRHRPAAGNEMPRRLQRTPLLAVLCLPLCLIGCDDDKEKQQTGDDAPKAAATATATATAGALEDNELVEGSKAVDELSEAGIVNAIKKYEWKLVGVKKIGDNGSVWEVKDGVSEIVVEISLIDAGSTAAAKKLAHEHTAGAHKDKAAARYGDSKVLLTKVTSGVGTLSSNAQSVALDVMTGFRGD